MSRSRATNGLGSRASSLPAQSGPEQRVVWLGLVEAGVGDHAEAEALGYLGGLLVGPDAEAVVELVEALGEEGGQGGLDLG